MAPKLVIVATVAASAGVVAAPYARALASNITENAWVHTGVVMGTGIGIAAAGFALDGAPRAAAVGFGGGLTLGALCDHLGF